MKTKAQLNRKIKNSVFSFTLSKVSGGRHIFFRNFQLNFRRSFVEMFSIELIRIFKFSFPKFMGFDFINKPRVLKIKINKFSTLNRSSCACIVNEKVLITNLIFLKRSFESLLYKNILCSFQIRDKTLRTLRLKL